MWPPGSKGVSVLVFLLDFQRTPLHEGEGLWFLCTRTEEECRTGIVCSPEFLIGVDVRPLGDSRLCIG